MTPTKTAVLTLILLGMLIIACSLVSPRENKLVGKWQSTKPDSVHLQIAKGEESLDGFYYGFSYTEGGQTYTEWWRIRDGDNQSTILLLSPKVRPGGGVSVADYASHHRVIELTADKFVVEWGFNDLKRVVEFQRVK